MMGVRGKRFGLSLCSAGNGAVFFVSCDCSCAFWNHVAFRNVLHGCFVLPSSTSMWLLLCWVSCCRAPWSAKMTMEHKELRSHYSFKKKKKFKDLEKVC